MNKNLLKGLLEELKNKINESKTDPSSLGYAIFNTRRDILRDLEGFDNNTRYQNNDLAEMLYWLYDNKKYAIGVYWTTLDNVNRIFAEGLVNLDSSLLSLSSQITFYRNQYLFEKNITSDIKNEGYIIVKIPKSYIGKASGEVKPIFHKLKDKYYLLNEFIYGYVDVKNNNMIKLNPNYTDKHNIDNNNLKCDSRALHFKKSKNEEIIETNLSLYDKYCILEKCYIETMDLHGEDIAYEALIQLILYNKIDGFVTSEAKEDLKKNVLYSDIIEILGYKNKQEKDYDLLIASFKTEAYKKLKKKYHV